MTDALPRLRRRYVDTRQGQVHLQEAGEAGAPALVMVQMTSFASPLMAPVLTALAQRGWHALALDLMGYGRSDKRQGPWLVSDFADNIEEAVQGAGVAPVGLVCGHFSCWIGVEIAARRPLPLPSLRGLVLDGSPRYTAAQRADMMAALPGPQTWHEDGAHMQVYWDKVWRILHKVNPGMPLAEVPDQRFREAVMCLLEASVYEHGTQLAAASFELEQRLPRVALPTLVVCSDTDWNLPHHEAIVAGLARAQSLRLPGVHPLHDLAGPSRGADYARHLHEFFAALPAAVRVGAAEPAAGADAVTLR